jgi:hypothetical protein
LFPSQKKPLFRREPINIFRPLSFNRFLVSSIRDGQPAQIADALAKYQLSVLM